MSDLNRIKGALFGLAIGDALGGTTEFMKEEDIKKKYGYLTEIIGNGIWGLAPGETTDDTAMTLAVAQGILDNPYHPIEPIGERFQEWVQTKPKDIGLTVSYALSFYWDDNNWDSAAQKTDDFFGGKSAGNGTLMRCLPIALAYTDLTRIEELSIKQSKMTHMDSLASIACVIYNCIAFDVLRHNIPLKEAIKNRVTGTMYESILHKDPDCLPTGYVVNTLLWVLRVLYTSETYEEVVQILANKGEDSDTTAAIAGGLMGLSVGFENLPERYVEALLLKETLHDVSEKIWILQNKNTAQ